MKQGTLELAFLAVAFLSLQVWWIKMTIKNSHNEKVIDINKDLLSERKKQLEKLF